MNRFKFRAWDVSREKMFNVLELEFDNHNSFEAKIHGEGTRCHNMFEYIGPKWVMQCTGLEDKNGALIYEGDILDWGNQNVEVKYGGCSFGFHGLKKGANGFVPYSYDTITNEKVFTMSDMEIIGNIYENPELLEKA